MKDLLSLINCSKEVNTFVIMYDTNAGKGAIH